jgi:DNA-binding ferritin-like protein
VSSSVPHDPTAALNQALSEVIDEVQELKQARWQVSPSHPLHALLDDLFADLTAWARLLIEQDDALGVSPLATMPSVAGRTRSDLWPGAASDDDVRRLDGEHLDRLTRHVAAALAEQEEDTSRAVLAEVERGLIAQRRALSET